MRSLPLKAITMIQFFGSPTTSLYAVEVDHALNPTDIPKLSWLFGDQPHLDALQIQGLFIGPRAAMITPWSTNAVEITQNMGILGIRRIERFIPDASGEMSFDPMLAQKYTQLNQELYTINIEPAPIEEVRDIAAYNESEGLALSAEEITWLARPISRMPTNRPIRLMTEILSPIRGTKESMSQLKTMAIAAPCATP